jgi:hypothetical protein
MGTTLYACSLTGDGASFADTKKRVHSIYSCFMEVKIPPYKIELPHEAERHLKKYALKFLGTTQESFFIAKLC